MKKPFLALTAAIWITFSVASVNAEQFSFFGSTGNGGGISGFDAEPFSSVLSENAAEPLKIFSDANIAASFVPLELDQLVVSLVDVSKKEGLLGGKKNFVPSFKLSTGIKTETYLTDFQTSLIDELFSENSTFEVTSSVLFVGIDLDFDSGYVSGNAFMGRPLDTFANRLYHAGEPEDSTRQGLDTDALGFEASAGYQLNNKIAVGAGFGRMNDKNNETEQVERVYAVYAQAVLALGRGIQVKPEFGQIERIKEKPDEETKDESYYAGAIWEINF